MDQVRTGRVNNSKRKNYYRNSDYRRRKTGRYLEKGLKGFICTCNFKEDQCVREAYNILNEYSETPEPDLPSIVGESTEEVDIERALTEEVAALQAESRRDSNTRKFQVVDTEARNCVFIKTTVPDPVQLVVRILEDISLSKKQKCRFLLRMLPIEVTCKANIEDMKDAFRPLVEKYFTSEGKTFSIIYRARCNNSILRDEVIDEFAGKVKDAHPLNRADLNNPELAVLVEIIKGICCIGVVPHFIELRKYNLMELASPTPKPNVEAQSKSDDSKAENEMAGVCEEGEKKREEERNVGEEMKVKMTESESNGDNKTIVSVVAEDNDVSKEKILEKNSDEN